MAKNDSTLTGEIPLQRGGPTWGEHMKVVGEIDHQLSICELFMSNVLRVMLGCSAEAASAILYSLDSTNGKKNLLKRVAEKTCDDDEQKFIEDMNCGYQKVSNQRREIAHGVTLFETKDFTGKFMVYRPKSGSKKQATTEWHDHLNKHSREGLAECLKALERFFQKRGLPLELKQGPDSGENQA